MAEKGTVVVIGAGTAGNAAARSLARAGWRVVQAERDRWGGTCLWRGCIPKKSLYRSAAIVRAVRDAEQFGVMTRDAAIDWQTVLGWKWHAQTTFAGDQEGIARDYGIELVHGDAAFTGPDSVSVAGRAITADHIVIATGSQTVLPPIPRAELADDSNDALHYDSLPESLLIVGGGFIAFEMAGIFASFGTQVTVVTRPSRFLDMLDPDLGDTAVRALRTLGVRFEAGCTLTGLEGRPGDMRATLEDAEGAMLDLRAERVLMAVGRRPAVDDLDLAAAGVMTDSRGHIVVDQYLRTTNSRIWAAGDAAGGMMQTPVANLEGRTVARSIDEGVATHPDCAAMPITCFTVPQLATVGLTETDARERGVDVHVNLIRLDAIGAAIIDGETDGFIKLVVDDTTGKVVGTQIASPNAGDLIYSAAMGIRAGISATDLGATVAVHPSHAELVYYAGE